MVSSHPRTLSALDHARILRLLPQAGAQDLLRDLLDNADLLPPREVPPGLVTMYSQVLLADAGGGVPRRVTLCYPDDAEPAAGFLSVLSPLGTALLGARVGDEVYWSSPDGRRFGARVLALLFQPEASGDFTL
ncbi:GreA/GreB family elongation factor [Tepidimonas taiwanensis]|uniref:GreA/GreB family elongation factor n=1 Tax=Tepidimonas taiwanensis TaxID=307486 RepID=UPI000733FF36|nr:GreA/GreB family elongation factor [Tepidimonas taiwanensis]MCX7692618.1 GreA/GreB family elongation factor [Tepidimonas taiwanensis]MDM7462628.1 GreA/GreB family elongation factor [Tepidimonas taiwanensis]